MTATARLCRAGIAGTSTPTIPYKRFSAWSCTLGDNASLLLGDVISVGAIDVVSGERWRAMGVQVSVESAV